MNITPPHQKPESGPTPGRVRSTFLLIVGVGIIVYEARWAPTDRPWLYGVALVMMGLISPEVVISIVETFSPRRGGNQK